MQTSHWDILIIFKETSSLLSKYHKAAQVPENLEAFKYSEIIILVITK